LEHALHSQVPTRGLLRCAHITKYLPAKCFSREKLGGKDEKKTNVSRGAWETILIFNAKIRVHGHNVFSFFSRCRSLNEWSHVEMVGMGACQTCWYLFHVDCNSKLTFLFLKTLLFKCFLWVK